eukprot:TRINITY_DN2688_c0_g1_i11.p1 TRINITY_DN2688_c0_g1~~TRINITY_DN2688_c0_g1_i11.p1  ORF type:complete len:547 (-),score=56.25 TRINITY_DN2688_c0_g1_i11:386-1894(-)
MLHAGCGHCMCLECWKGYIAAALDQGASCVDLRCFQQKCLVAVPRQTILKVCNEAQIQRFEIYERQTFVDENPKMSWCTGGGCNCIIHSRSPQGLLDVQCTCGETFCFQCKGEAHQPAKCKTVEEWLRKAGAESENLNYILANTKPCPKCKRAIEKNQGCNHMTCTQCKHQFCWLCKEDWKKHGEGTGGYYSCNKYEAAKRRGEHDEEEAKRQHAQDSLMRYTHYFERYTAHDKGMKLALVQVDKYRKEDGIEHLSEKLRLEANEVKFLLESWVQVVSCRRVLKWTYAFGYYRFESKEYAELSNFEANGPNLGSQEFFEFLQGEAEYHLERLHSVLEKDLGNLNLDNIIAGDELDDKLIQDFMNVKLDLVRLTDITKNYFGKLVRALESGVDTMELNLSVNQQNNSQDQHNTPATSSSAVIEDQRVIEQSNKETSRQKRRTQQKKQTEAPQTPQVIDLTEPTDTVDPIELQWNDGWQCQSCTLINEIDAEVCEACLAARPRL